MGGKREKLLLEKAGRKGEGGTADPSQSFFVLHLVSRSLGRFGVFLARSIQKWPHEVLKAATSQTNRAIFICHCGFSMGTLAIDAAPPYSALNRE